MRACWLAVALLGCAGARAVVTGSVTGADASGPCVAALGPTEGDLLTFSYFKQPEAWILDGVGGAWDGYPQYIAWEPRMGSFHATISVQRVTVVPRASTAAGGRAPALALAPDGSSSWLGEIPAVALPRPRVVATRAGLDVRWPAAPGAPACGASALAWENELGWNVYRLPTALVPRGASTPQLFLGGPDLNPSTSADNGFVGFVRYDASSGDGLVHYLDASTTDPGAFLYAVQPVLWFASPVQRPDGWVEDPDGDGIRTQDLDGDGDFDLVDPVDGGDRFQLGLTMSLDGVRTILTSGEQSDADVLLFVRRAGADVRFDWDAMIGYTGAHDLYVDELARANRMAGGDAMTPLACGLPGGPSSITLPDPAGMTAPLFYLLSVNWPEGSVLGHDSLGGTRLRTRPCQ